MTTFHDKAWDLITRLAYANPADFNTLRIIAYDLLDDLDQSPDQSPSSRYTSRPPTPQIKLSETPPESRN